MPETIPAEPASHATIQLERRLDAPPASVFAAFADESLRRRWVRMPGRVTAIAHEFRVGGGEQVRVQVRLEELRDDLPTTRA